MGLYFGLIGVGLAVAAVFGGALVWDGSAHLLRVLQQQAPYVPDGRLLDLLLDAPLVLALRASTDFAVLRPLFGLSHACVPLVSLAGSWLVVRDTRATLFVWPALAIGMATLPTQLQLSADDLQVVQLFWPVFLAAAIGLPRAKLIYVAVFGAAAFVCHPSAVVLFSLASALAWWIGVRVRADRRWLWGWAAALGVTAVGRLLVFGQANWNEQLQAGLLQSTYFESVDGGLLLLAMICTFMAGMLVLALGQVRGSLEGTDALTILAASVVACILVAAALLEIRTLNAQTWMSDVGLKYWALIATLPFLIMAGLEAVWSDVRPISLPAFNERFRLRLSQVTGCVFLVVISSQSIAWLDLTHRLRDTLTASSEPCLTQRTLQWTQRTALNHWSLGALAIVLQSRTPQRLVLDGTGCEDLSQSSTVAIDPWDTWRPGGSLLDLSSVLGREQPSGPCWLSLRDANGGWYNLEQHGPWWWRWSSGNGVVHVWANQALDVVLAGRIKSAPVPNRVKVLVNGQTASQIDVASTDVQSFPPLNLTMQPGLNVLEFQSESPAITLGSDPRAMAMMLGNLRLTTATTLQSCDVHS